MVEKKSGRLITFPSIAGQTFFPDLAGSSAVPFCRRPARQHPGRQDAVTQTLRIRNLFFTADWYERNESAASLHPLQMHSCDTLATSQSS